MLIHEEFSGRFFPVFSLHWATSTWLLGKVSCFSDWNSRKRILFWRKGNSIFVSRRYVIKNNYLKKKQMTAKLLWKQFNYLELLKNSAIICLWWQEKLILISRRDIIKNYCWKKADESGILAEFFKISYPELSFKKSGRKSSWLHLLSGNHSQEIWPSLFQILNDKPE